MINQTDPGISTPLEQGIKQAGNGGHGNHGIDAGLESKQGDKRDDNDYQGERRE